MSYHWHQDPQKYYCKQSKSTNLSFKTVLHIGTYEKPDISNVFSDKRKHKNSTVGSLYGHGELYNLPIKHQSVQRQKKAQVTKTQTA